MAGRLGCDTAHDVLERVDEEIQYKGISPVDVHLAYDGVVQAIATDDIVMSMKTPRGTKKGMLIGV